MKIEVSGEVWFWRGPAPHHFVTVPEKESRELKEIARQVTYGWGMIPVTVAIGSTQFYTALWEKDGRYILPIKAVVRKAEKLEIGDTVTAQLEIGRLAT